MGGEDGGRVLRRAGPALRLRDAAGSLGAVLRNRDLRSLELGWTISTAADWALLVVALLVAYDAGGPVLVGLVSLIRLVPATLVNVLVNPGTFARPERVLVAVNLLRLGAGSVVAAAILLEQPWVALAAVGVAAAAAALVRPTTMSLLPAVATTPEELVSANVASALGEAAGTFAGPLLAGIAVAASGPAPAAALSAAACLAAAAITSWVVLAEAARPRRRGDGPSLPIVDGIRELVARRAAGVVMLAFLAQVAVRGALTTYLAVLSIEVLGLGEGGVGLLSAAIGLGGLVGSIGALALGSGRALAPVAMVALGLWGLPIAVIGVLPATGVALVGLGIVGLANSLLDVSGFTLLQRGIPNDARTAVFSVLEMVAGLGGSVGGVLGSALLAGLGVEAALVGTGLVLPAVAALAWPFAHRLDAAAVVPEEQARLLRAIPLFRPLPLAGMELLATAMREARFAPGEALMREGDPGETYLVVERGRVAVSAGGRHVREQGPGEGVGEIALLRSGPRTATVIAIEPVEAWAIDCAAFLAAVTGHAGSASTAASLVASRLADDRARDATG